MSLFHRFIILAAPLALVSPPCFFGCREDAPPIESDGRGSTHDAKFDSGTAKRAPRRSQTGGQSLLDWDVAADAAGNDPSRLSVPEEILDVPWLEQRRELQLQSKSNWTVFANFRFTDQLPQSGITFVNRTVDDAGKSFKAVHYDHGNGLAVADVDGDGLLDIYFVTQLGSNQLWRNLGDGKFENWTDTAGAGVADRVGVTASMADIDNDGDADLYVTTVRGGNVLFENQGDGRFRDISKSSGLDYIGHSSAAIFFDYNRDGLLDLFLTNVGNYTTDEKGPGDYYLGQTAAFGNHLKPQFHEQSILFKNIGGNRFVDASEEANLVDIGWSGDACPLDANEDGWTDLYVLNMQGHDEYYENVNGRFSRKSRERFPASPWGTMGIGVFDHDNDGDMDIFVTDMHTDMFDPEPFRQYVSGHEKMKLAKPHRPSASFLATDGNHVFGNAFYRNNGDGSFTEVSDQVNAENYWPWGLSVGDLNADGYQDVFIASSMNYTFRYAVNSVLLNSHGQKFVDSEFVLGVEPRRDGRTAKAWFELDCSGQDKDHPLCAGRSGRIVVWGALGSRSSAIFDLDNDGDMDIVTNDFNSEPMVLVSNLTTQKETRFLKLTLIGSSSNRDGLGAKVIVTSDSGSLTKVHDGKSGYLSQSRIPLYFGLGEAERVDQIHVQWPSGIRQTLSGPIELNMHLVVREPSPDPPSNAGADDSAYHVYPGQPIQSAIELAASDPVKKIVKVHAGTYRPQTKSQALVHFNRRHDGVTVEAVGEVILTAANPSIADPSDASYPAVVNHVVYFGDGVSRNTVFRGFAITGANGFVTRSEQPDSIQPATDQPSLEKGLFFYSDGGAIKIFGRSYPTIENVVAHDNSTRLCGGAVSVEHQGFNQHEVYFRSCIFKGNRCPATGSAIDLLPGSAAIIENCLFVGNISNTGMDQVKKKYGLTHNEAHGSGALTVFEGSRVQVQRCTFTDNWNGVDDQGQNNVYRSSIFWMNTASDGTRPGAPYELNVTSGAGVLGCYINGQIDDLQHNVDPRQNVLNAPDPEFDEAYRPTNRAYDGVGYRPD